jgi:hypothetical protein
MTNWTMGDLLKLDLKYAKVGIPHHQRPFRAAEELLGSSLAIGVGGNPEFGKIVEAYRLRFPEVDTTWPGAGIGIAASVDQVRKVTLGVVYGGMRLETWQALGFTSAEEWWTWCRADNDIAAETSFALADLHDFASGFREVEHGNAKAAPLWHMARSNLEDVANIMPLTFSVDSVLQPICLVAELVIKGTLVWYGADPNSFKGKNGHNFVLLSEQMVKAKSHRDDELVDLVASKLPAYVGNRYSPAGLTRYKVVRLALGVQFIAASALRRVAHADLAAQMETGGWPASRRPFFPEDSG